MGPAEVVEIFFQPKLSKMNIRFSPEDKLEWNAWTEGVEAGKKVRNGPTNLGTVIAVNTATLKIIENWENGNQTDARLMLAGLITEIGAAAVFYSAENTQVKEQLLEIVQSLLTVSNII